MDATTQTEFSIYLAHRPGELAGVLEALDAAGVDVQAVCVVDQDERGLVRLLAQPEERVREVFESLVVSGAGPVFESQVLVVSADGRPGVVRDVAAQLALAGVNVRYAYGAPASKTAPGRCVFRVSNLEEALRVVRAIA